MATVSNSNSIIIDQKEKSKDVSTLAWLQQQLICYWPTVSFMGVQMSWAVQIGYVTPVLRQLGLPDSKVGLVWLAGPISGIFVQPIVGVYSDHCTSRFGRRRIFVFGGTICTILGLLMFSNAKALGLALSGGKDDAAQRIGLAAAVISFWLLDFSINVAQGPLRALLADVVPPQFHAKSNALFSGHNGLGKLLGYGLGALALYTMPGLKWFKTEVRALYTICAVLVSITCFMTLWNTPETAWKPETALASEPPKAVEFVPRDVQANSHKVTLGDVVLKIWEGLKTVPTPIARAMAVQFMAYFTWDCTFIYGSDWVGKEVYGGNPNAMEGTEAYIRFEEGVRAANFGYFLMAATSILYASFLPIICHKFGSARVWGATFFLHALLMFSTLAVKQGQHEAAVCIIALMGFPLAMAYQIPWSIVTVTLSSEKFNETRGLYTTIFNLSQSAPEILISLLSGPCVAIFHGRVS